MGFFNITGYGLTETSPVIHVDTDPCHPGTIGKIVPNTEVRVRLYITILCSSTGLTETSPVIHVDTDPCHPGTIGKIVPNTEVRVSLFHSPLLIYRINRNKSYHPCRHRSMPSRHHRENCT